ncbi:sigma-70 family RNA polymerase sigma factor [Petrocella sp. FN5]|uniref:sigma-70 family RNA polymerase sigma factor n=1 Tax=Petrocella sp. FN5 TaxID=3032002 RepID=UPI0023D9EEA6|nr:sigma-70 family RNA polymerase sigma factor [Petrocella sp. FN5]MDF1616119.1 sigma-70 family RNA polymerase sigma factor [Petrocella sp. FN5]
MNEKEEREKALKRYFIPVDGKYYETTKEVYEVYYQMDRRERYLEERDLNKGVINFCDIDNEDYSAEEILSDKDTDIEEEVINSVLIKTVLEAMSLLSEEEKWLIQELFFCGKSERELTRNTGIPRKTINYRKEKALSKIRKFIKI